jgi:hypothetical protein
MTLDTCPAMKKIVAPNNFRFGIRKEGEGVSAPLTETPRDFGRIHADRDGANTER